MDRADFLAAVDRVIAGMPFGKASAAKRGRNPRWPYVPIIELENHATAGYMQAQTQQVRGRAYATRDEAVACAQRVIDANRESARRRLIEPRFRAFRQQHGLPIEVPA